MKKHIQIISLLLISYTICNAQENWEKYQFSKLPYEEKGFKAKDPQFKEFLDLFYHIPLPLNYNLGLKKNIRIFPLSTKQRSFTISTNYLKRFLGLKEEDLIYNYYNTDDGMDAEVKKKWYSGEAFLIAKDIVGLEVYTSYYTTDPVDDQTIIYTFNAKKEICDSMILKGSINKHGVYDSFVLLDGKHFKTFRYTINESNIKYASYAFEDFYVEYKDKENYRTQCVISDYEITDEGKIKLMEVSEPILLKHDAWKYTSSSVPAFDDDPMNRDWNEYLERRKKP